MNADERQQMERRAVRTIVEALGVEPSEVISGVNLYEDLVD